MEKYNVVIIGAGPAGLKAAEVLASTGKKVVVFEKNKVIGPKVCAGGLTNKDLGFIDKSLIERSFNSFRVSHKNKSITLTDKKPFVYTINRKNLGLWQLKQAKKAGAEIKTNIQIKKIKNNSVIINNKEVKFGYLIGADGSNSIVRKYLGLRTNKIVITLQYTIKKKFDNVEAFYDRSKFGLGYVWIFPHKNYAKVGCGTHTKSIKMDKLRGNFHLWLKEKNISFSSAKLESAVINYGYEGYKFGNIFLVGDAAGFASELTGEGIYHAISSGVDVAKKIIDPNYKCKSIQRILRMKKRDRKLLNLMSNKIWVRITYIIALVLIKNKIIRKKLISNFSS